MRNLPSPFPAATGLWCPMTANCPECGVGNGPLDQPHFGLDLIDITTPDDRGEGNIRLALRCQGCGYAASFIARKKKWEIPFDLCLAGAFINEY